MQLFSIVLQQFINFKDTNFRDYVVVKNEENPKVIADKIKECLEHEDEIMASYKKWKKENDKKSEESVKEFLSM